MNAVCSNHPGLAAHNTCRGCGRPFCADCLLEGLVYYYCAAPECRRLLEEEALPESVPCPNCRETLLLDRDERLSRRFRCPGCHRFTDLSKAGPSGKDSAAAADAESAWYLTVRADKLVVMSVATVGLYQLYWFWKNWELLRARTGRRIVPILRTLFAVLFSFELFREVQRDARSLDLEPGFHPGWLAAGYLCAHLAWYLPAPYHLLGAGQWLISLPVQKAINRMAATTPGWGTAPAGYSNRDVAIVATGCLVLTLLFVVLPLL